MRCLRLDILNAVRELIRWTSDNATMLHKKTPLLKRDNSDEETCNEAKIELRRKTKVKRNMPVLLHGKTWGSLCESEK